MFRKISIEHATVSDYSKVWTSRGVMTRDKTSVHEADFGLFGSLSLREELFVVGHYASASYKAPGKCATLLIKDTSVYPFQQSTNNLKAGPSPKP